MKCLLSRFFLGLLIAVLVSCGYHLRGQTKIPEHALPVYLSANNDFHDLRRALIKQFKRAEVKMTSNQSSAATVITVISVKKLNNVISVDSLGRTSEVKLSTIVDIDIRINKFSFHKKIRVFKDIAFNPENILAYKKEEKLLYNEMYAQVSRLVLLQIQAKAKHSR